MGWLYDGFAAQADILAAVDRMAQTLTDYRGENLEVSQLAECYYSSWRKQNAEDTQQVEEQLGADRDLAEHVFELFAFLGAIDWLRFWSDKGFEIIADY